MQKHVQGFILYELLIAISLFGLIASMQVPIITFWKETYAWLETIRLAQAIRTTSAYAVSTGINQVITIDPETGSYHGPLDEHTLTDTVVFQAPPDALGPPSTPLRPITKPVTFVNNQVHLFYTGIISGGSAYLKNQTSLSGYAICNGVNLISRLRTYHFSQTWKLL